MNAQLKLRVAQCNDAKFDVYPGRIASMREVVNILREKVDSLDADNAVMYGEKFMAECRIAELKEKNRVLEESVQNLCDFIDTTLKSLGYVYVIDNKVVDSEITVDKLEDIKVRKAPGPEDGTNYVEYPYARESSGF